MSFGKCDCSGLVAISFVIAAVLSMAVTGAIGSCLEREAINEARFEERCKFKGGQVFDGRCYGGAEEITIDGR